MFTSLMLWKYLLLIFILKECCSNHSSVRYFIELNCPLPITNPHIQSVLKCITMRSLDWQVRGPSDSGIYKHIVYRHSQVDQKYNSLIVVNL